MNLDTEKTARLEALLARLQQRWGRHVIRQGPPAKTPLPAVVATGFASLDGALAGGIPVGQVSELLGRPTCGMTTLAYKIIASAQSTRAYGIYIDVDSTFDADYAGRCGVALERIFVARPDTGLQALDIGREVLDSSPVAVLALDMGTLPPEGYRLRRLTSVLRRTGGVVLVLRTLPVQTRSPMAALNSPAALRLLVERQGWLERQTDVRGYRARVTVLKHRTATGKQVDLDIDFDDTITGEPL